MKLVGDYSNAHFAGSSDGNGGTLITLNANDDAPAFAPAEKLQTATVTEIANTTGSSASDPSSPASGTHSFHRHRPDRPADADDYRADRDIDRWPQRHSVLRAEIQALEHAFSLTQPVNTNNGVDRLDLSITDSALDFLGAGEKATVTSTITLDDHQGGTDTATVTVTIDGRQRSCRRSWLRPIRP